MFLVRFSIKRERADVFIFSLFALFNCYQLNAFNCYQLNAGLNLHHRILALLIYCIVLYFSCISVRVRVQFYFERAHYLFIYLIDVYI